MSDKFLKDTIETDGETALRVEGIESWIQTLVPLQEPNGENAYEAVRMVDPVTKAVFAVARLK